MQRIIDAIKEMHPDCEVVSIHLSGPSEERLTVPELKDLAIAIRNAKPITSPEEWERKYG